MTGSPYFLDGSGMAKRQKGAVVAPDLRLFNITTHTTTPAALRYPPFCFFLKLQIIITFHASFVVTLLSSSCLFLIPVFAFLTCINPDDSETRVSASAST